MNKNKYYTPEIEEFHVGFNYERLHKLINYDQQWHTEEVTHIKNDLTFFNKEIKENRIRVKYLDKQDIEDLGFNDKHYDGVHPLDSFFRIRYDTVYQITVYWNARKDNRENLVRIFKGKLHNYPYTEIFRGNIKNKSELSKLMKQLNII